MNAALVTGGILTVVIGLVHSVLGEHLIFRRMRDGTIVPDRGHPLLGERHLQILWATWHTVTVFGFGFAAMLFHAAGTGPGSAPQEFLLGAIAVSTAVAGLLVFFATKGRHPGWAGLVLVAVCIWLA